MSKLIELKQQKTKLLLDAQALVTKKDATKEDRQKAHAMLADVNPLEQDIAIEERVHWPPQKFRVQYRGRKQPFASDQSHAVRLRTHHKCKAPSLFHK